MKWKKGMIVLIAGGLFFGCAERQATPGVTDTEILIGNIQDLSGPMKELGYELPHGSKLYFRYINEQGGIFGRQIRMLVEDHQYNPQKTVTAAKKLIEKDQVFCLYNVIGTSPSEAIRPLLEEYGIPLVAPATQSGTMSDLSRPAWKYIFHTDTGYDKQVNILVDYILEQAPGARIGLIYQDDDYGANVLKGVAEAETRHGITVQKEAYQRGATDFAGQVGNLMKGDVSHVIIAGVVKEPIIVMKTAAAIGYKTQFLGLSPTMDHRVALGAGPAGEGYIAANFVYLWNSDAPGARLYRELHAKYAEEGHQMGMYNFYGFATATVLVEGLKRAGKRLTRESLIKGLESIRDWDSGVLPPFSYGPNDRAGAEVVALVQVKNGQQVMITDWIDGSGIAP
ncbi:MAG: ABC transporter substrate-binding protein [Fidelibacterota bacterium]